MSADKFETSFSSEISVAKNVVETSLKFIKDSTINASNDALGEVKLVLCELLYNAVIHGNKKNEAKKVFISIKIMEDDTIFAVITDEGRGFDYKSFISEKENIDIEDLFDEHGRGIKLAVSLVDKIKFECNGSRIEFVKKVT